MVLNYLNTVSRITFGRGELDQYDKFTVRATIVRFKNDDIDDVMYEGCPDDSCKKKVHQQGRSWYCPKCDESYHNFVWRYKLRVYIEDPSRRATVTMFDSTAIPLLDMSAANLRKTYKRKPYKYNLIFEGLIDETFYFTIKTALVMFDERPRLNNIMVHSRPVH